MLTDNLQIAIVGGGPGGLTLARLLQQQGAAVKVYERDANMHARAQGATLDLHEESGLAALRKAGLMDDFYAADRPHAGKMRIMDGQGKIYVDDHESGAGFTELRPEIDRGPLRALLLNSLAPDTVQWNTRFSSMQKEGSGRRIYFADGTSAYADLVIGADGANSGVRPYITDIKPVYSGVSMVEGNIYNAAEQAPGLWQLTAGGKVMALANGQSLILSAKGDGCLSFYTGNKVPESWRADSNINFNDKAQVAAWFKQAYSSWGSMWHELFNGSGDAWYIPRPQYYYPLNQHWQAQGDVTMLGDAAHLMPPFAGEGVNMAMQDAMELADCLLDENFDTMHTAVAAYESAMLSRAAAVTEDTLMATEMLHGDNALRDMVK